MSRPTAPLRAADVQALIDGTGLHVISVGVTGSTNTDLASGYTAGTYRPGTVLIAQQQDAGKGRLGRRWEAAYGSSQILSILLRPTSVPVGKRGWIGAILGLSLRAAIANELDIRADLKWPNDILIGGRKCAGILAELVGDALVVGGGVNLDLTDDEFPARQPGSTAFPPTSLQLAAPSTPIDRVPLAAATLREFAARVNRWEGAAGDVTSADENPSLLDEYRAACSTLGKPVRLELPGGNHVTGVAETVTGDGSLVIRAADGTTTTYTAGDVVHLRPA